MGDSLEESKQMEEPNALIRVIFTSIEYLPRRVGAIASPMMVI